MRKLIVPFVCGLAALAVGNSSAIATTCPAIGFANDCNLILTVNSNLTITATVTTELPYDGVEDQLVGVVNNSQTTITSINLSGGNIFGFDGDGAGNPGSGCVVKSSPPNPCFTGGPFDQTGYAGPGTSFTNSDSDNGTVFFNPGIAPGGTAWFSLEEQASANIRGGGVNTVPEPGSMMLLGSGLLGFFWKRRRA
jgi:hypothetical protein